MKKSRKMESRAAKRLKRYETMMASNGTPQTVKSAANRPGSNKRS